MILPSADDDARDHRFALVLAPFPPCSSLASGYRLVVSPCGIHATVLAPIPWLPTPPWATRGSLLPGAPEDVASYQRWVMRERVFSSSRLAPT